VQSSVWIYEPGGTVADIRIPIRDHIRPGQTASFDVPCDRNCPAGEVSLSGNTYIQVMEAVTVRERVAQQLSASRQSRVTNT
jgi:hypothetical protein